MYNIYTSEIIWPDMKFSKHNSEPVGTKHKFTGCVLARKYTRNNTFEDAGVIQRCMLFALRWYIIPALFTSTVTTCYYTLEPALSTGTQIGPADVLLLLRTYFSTSMGQAPCRSWQWTICHSPRTIHEHGSM